MPSFYAIDKAAIDGEVVVVIEGRCRPDEGSSALLFERAGGDINFLARASIVRPIYETLPSGRKGPGRFELEDFSEIGEERPLSALAGSLEKTRFFLEPERHFKQVITSLSYRDFETIISGKVDMARSIFRMTFHALPLPLQAQFVLEHADLYPAFEGRSHHFNYPALAATLLNFFEERFGAGFELLQLLEGAYPASLEGVPPLQELYVSEGEDVEGGTDSIPVGRGTLTLLSFSRESFVFRGLPGGLQLEGGESLAELPALSGEHDPRDHETGTDEVATESLAEVVPPQQIGFIGTARAALSEGQDRMFWRRKWTDTIF